MSYVSYSVFNSLDDILYGAIILIEWIGWNKSTAVLIKPKFYVLRAVIQDRLVQVLRLLAAIITDACKTL